MISIRIILSIKVKRRRNECVLFLRTKHLYLKTGVENCWQWFTYKKEKLLQVITLLSTQQVELFSYISKNRHKDSENDKNYRATTPRALCTLPPIPVDESNWQKRCSNASLFWTNGQTPHRRWDALSAVSTLANFRLVHPRASQNWLP